MVRSPDPDVSPVRSPASAPTRRSISSRIGRTAVTSWTAWSSSGQSRWFITVGRIA